MKVATKKEICLPLRVSEIDSVEVTYDIPPEISAPCDPNTNVGKVDIYASKNLIFSDKLYIIESVEKLPEKSPGKNIILDFIHAK